MGTDIAAFLEFCIVEDTALFPVDQRCTADERGPSLFWPSVGLKGAARSGGEARFLGSKAGGASGHLEYKCLCQPMAKD